jgi:2-keto-3-deoxy-L-rhamnonate aldolase RhmA
MKENRAKRILREGGLALGTHVGSIADPQIVELIGLAGFDAAFIDMEHTCFDLHDVQLAVMAAERVGITPIVRTPGFDPAFILRLLDMGVQGIQVRMSVTPQRRAPRSRPCATRHSATAAWRPAVAPPNLARSR